MVCMLESWDWDLLFGFFFFFISQFSLNFTAIKPFMIARDLYFFSISVLLRQFVGWRTGGLYVALSCLFFYFGHFFSVYFSYRFFCFVGFSLLHIIIMSLMPCVEYRYKYCMAYKFGKELWKTKPPLNQFCLQCTLFHCLYRFTRFAVLIYSTY